jgi:hypothetical protein
MKDVNVFFFLLAENYHLINTDLELVQLKGVLLDKNELR